MDEENRYCMYKIRTSFPGRSSLHFYRISSECTVLSLSPCAIFHLGIFFFFSVFGDFISLTDVVILLILPFYRSFIKMLSRKDLSALGLYPLGKPAIYYCLLFPIFNLSSYPMAA